MKINLMMTMVVLMGFAGAARAADFTCANRDMSVKVGWTADEQQAYIDVGGTKQVASLLKVDGTNRADLFELCPNIDPVKVANGVVAVQSSASDDSSVSIIVNGRYSFAVQPGHCPVLTCR